MLSTLAEITIKSSVPLDVVVYTCLECNNCRHKTLRSFDASLHCAGAYFMLYVAAGPLIHQPCDSFQAIDFEKQ